MVSPEGNVELVYAVPTVMFSITISPTGVVPKSNLNVLFSSEYSVGTSEGAEYTPASPLANDFSAKRVSLTITPPPTVDPPMIKVNASWGDSPRDINKLYGILTILKAVFHLADSASRYCTLDMKESLNLTIPLYVVTGDLYNALAVATTPRHTILNG